MAPGARETTDLCFSSWGKDRNLLATIWDKRLKLGQEAGILATVEPRSNGPATNGIPPVIDANPWSLIGYFFLFFCWQ